jgi:hypothetical protein
VQLWAWPFIVLTLASIPNQSAAATVRLKWTHPAFNSTADSCADDSTKPLLDLYREELTGETVPGGAPTSFGFVPATGFAGRIDSLDLEVSDSVHYATFQLRAEDGSGNRACDGNSVLVALPARDWEPGLAATYFDNEDLTAPFAHRTDGPVNFRWGTSAAIPGMGADLFSERWQGELNFTSSGVWGLSATVEDGWRAWVGGVYVMNDFGVQPVHTSGCQFQAQAGWAALVVEAMHHNGNAEIALMWTPPGGATVLVPASSMRH